MRELQSKQNPSLAFAMDFSILVKNQKSKGVQNEKSILFMFLTVLWFVGCESFPIEFDIPVESKTTIAKGTLLETTLSGFGFNQLTTIDLSTTQEFKNNNTSKENVVGTTIKSFSLEITSPSAQTFDFLDEISFFVSAPNLAKKRVATRLVPRNTRQFTLDIDAVELAEYVKSDSMSLSTEIKGRRPDNDTVIQAKVVFAVKAKLL